MFAPMALQVNYLGYLGDIIWYCHVFFTKNIFICKWLPHFFLFQIKTCGFHLKEEGKELLGMLMAALANNNGYYVLYLFPLSFSNKSIAIFKINWHLAKGANYI